MKLFAQPSPDKYLELILGIVKCYIHYKYVNFSNKCDEYFSEYKNSHNDARENGNKNIYRRISEIQAFFLLETHLLDLDLENIYVVSGARKSLFECGPMITIRDGVMAGRDKNGCYMLYGNSHDIDLVIETLHDFHIV